MPSKNKIALAIIVVAATIICLLVVQTLVSNHKDVNLSVQMKRNAAAADLYARLVNIPVSPSTSAITLTLHAFVQENDQTIGATLLDSDGQLIAQTGAGNDTLSEHFTDANRARIPVEINGHAYGHIVLAFEYAGRRFGNVIKYLGIGALSLALAALLCGLMDVHTRRAIS